MIQIWSMSDTGLVRKENQDAYAALLHEESGSTICVVCDGMGGTAGGAIASRVAVDTFVSEICAILRPGMTPQQLCELSSYACSMANKAVCEEAEKDDLLSRMGTTLVSAVSCGGNVVIANVGDSRAYHISEAGIRQITKDHSLVENMVDNGEITAEEARRHPGRNLITRALGPDMVSRCDSFICPVADGEYILLCTDGLVETVCDQELLFEVLYGDDPETCLDRLLAIAKSNGAPDNVTMVLMKILQEGGSD